MTMILTFVVDTSLENKTTRTSFRFVVCMMELNFKTSSTISFATVVGSYPRFPVPRAGNAMDL